MSLCACDEGEFPVVSELTDVRMARVAHTCTECERAILPGESYQRVWGVWSEYGAETLRTCAWCMDLKEFLKAHVPCYCGMIGTLMEDAAEAIDEYEELREDVAAMLAEIRARPALPSRYFPTTKE